MNIQDVKIKIYESNIQGDITDNERDVLLECAEEVFIEKKTREQYRRERFNRKYKFKPDKPGAKTGTVVIDGVTYRVDAGKSKYVSVHGLVGDEADAPRQTSATLVYKDPVIILDDEFFKLKNDQRRDALLYHEVGHTKYHQFPGDSSTLDKNMMTKDFIIDYILKLYNSAAVLSGMGKLSKEYEKEILRNCQPIIKKYADNTPKTESNEVKLRKEILAKLKKYEKLNGHTTTAEFEADTYAANKVGKKHLYKGIDEYAKRKIKKGAAIDSYNANTPDEYKLDKNRDKKTVDALNKDLNKANAEDLRSRKKALKEISSNPKYKNLYK